MGNTYLFVRIVYRGLGAHYAGTLLACVGEPPSLYLLSESFASLLLSSLHSDIPTAFLLSAIPFVLFKYGHNIRAKSKFAAQLARLAGEEEKKKLERWQRSEQKDLS